MSVDEAVDGAETLGKIAMLRYALVISDWFMEPMPGIKFLMKLRRTAQDANRRLSWAEGSKSCRA